MITRTQMDGGNGNRMSDYNIERALYDVEDLFQRTLVPFLLLGETARSIKNGEFVGGTAIEIGVKVGDLIPEALRTINSFSNFDGGFNKTELGYEYVSHGFPVKITIINKHYKFLENPEFVFYGPAEYRIPNPFIDYWKVKQLVR